MSENINYSMAKFKNENERKAYQLVTIKMECDAKEK